jgi:hypothetical protein
MKTKTTKMLKNTLGVVSFCFVLTVGGLLSGFSPVKTKINAQTKYAFITTTEFDKAYEGIDEGGPSGNNRFVDITSGIATVACDLSSGAIKYQFIDHYNAEEKTQQRNLPSGYPCSAWVYNTYDEAVASRRDWLAKSSRIHKRNISNFYVTCN